MKEKQRAITNKEIAEHLVGRDSSGNLLMTEKTVSRHLANCGIDKRESTMEEIRHAIMKRSIDQTVRKFGNQDIEDGEVDENARAKRLNNELTVEKIRLTASQADDSELKVDLKKHVIAPLAAMELAITKIATNAASKLEQIPIRVKRKLPNLTTRELEIISREIVAVQNEVAEIEISDDDLRQGAEIMNG
jgi:phage terminase Nu1 subunit (DNA packaging protein)